MEKMSLKNQGERFDVFNNSNFWFPGFNLLIKQRNFKFVEKEKIFVEIFVYWDYFDS